MSGEKYNREEISQLEGARTIGDAELIKNGANYLIHEDGSKQLILTEQQIETARQFYHEHNKNLERNPAVEVSVTELSEELQKIFREYGYTHETIPVQKIPSKSGHSGLPDCCLISHSGNSPTEERILRKEYATKLNSPISILLDCAANYYVVTSNGEVLGDVGSCHSEPQIKEIYNYEGKI